MKNIVVILRNAPDALEELTLVNGDLDWEEVPLTLNEFDDQALEEAILVKEETGATVVAVAIAAAGDRILHNAVARGADRAVSLVVEASEGASSRSLAPVFAEAVRRLDADVVLTGVQTPGDAFGQLTPFLGAELGWAQVNGVTAVMPAQDRVRVVHDHGGGRRATLAVSFPGVFGVQTARRPPRYVSGTRLRQALQAARIERLTVTIEPNRDAATLISLHAPSRTRAAKLFAGDPASAAGQIADLLISSGIKDAHHG